MQSGSKYFDEPVGNCRYSEITIFSFHPVKIVTTGEGGAALTNSDELAPENDVPKKSWCHQRTKFNDRRFTWPLVLSTNFIRLQL